VHERVGYTGLAVVAFGLLTASVPFVAAGLLFLVRWQRMARPAPAQP
jgi:hypothetical protein